MPRRLFGDFTIIDVALYLGLAGTPMLLHLLVGGLYTLELSAMMSAVNGATITLMLCLLSGRRRRLRVRREGGRRCEYLLDRIEALVESIPRKTEAETLAVIHEVRNCYVESIDVVERMGEGDTKLASKLRRNLGQIDELYDIQTGSLRCTEANAADFAAAMRKLGRDADGSLRG